MNDSFFLPPGVQSTLFQAFGRIPPNAPDKIREDVAEILMRRNDVPECDLELIDRVLLEYGVMAIDAPFLAMVRFRLGRRRLVSRHEMENLLADFSRAGGSLLNDYVHDTIPANDWKSVPGPEYISAAICAEGDRYHQRAAQAWVNVLNQTTLVSVGGDLENSVRFDEPGSMSPLQRSDVIFAAADSALKTLRYLRTKCQKLLLVRTADTDLSQP